jgi:undecaprenyl diphosphate synthase
MDGNGRWAPSEGFPRIAGHERGTENIRRITEAAVRLGIQYLTLWAFSTENWRRPQDEIAGIMRLLGEAIERETVVLHERGAQLRHIGSLDGLAPDLRQAVLSAIELTRDNHRLVLTLAFNYGGRQELVSAVRSLVEAGTEPDRIDEAEIGRHLFTRDLPDPDLIVRTSASTASATSCSGNRPTQSSCSHQCFGPTSAPTTSGPRSKSTPGVTAALAAFPGDPPPRWGNRQVRARVVGSVAVVIGGLVPTIAGGPVFVALMVLIGLVGYHEFAAVCRTSSDCSSDSAHRLRGNRPPRCGRSLCLAPPGRRRGRGGRHLRPIGRPFSSGGGPGCRRRLGTRVIGQLLSGTTRPRSGRATRLSRRRRRDLAR